MNVTLWWSKYSGLAIRTESRYTGAIEICPILTYVKKYWYTP